MRITLQSRPSHSFLVLKRSASSHATMTGYGLASGVYATDYSYDANGNILSMTRRDDAGAKYDELEYHYTTGNNQLEWVDDPQGSPYTDIAAQSSGNYLYGESPGESIGNSRGA